MSLSPETANEEYSADALRTINRVTGLSTDYLNHYNELIMLLELLGDMPEMIDEVRAWQPMSYVDHFRESKLAIGPAAIHCYETADPDVRAPFDQAVDALDTFLNETLTLIAQFADAGDHEAMGNIAGEGAAFARRVVAHISGIVNGSRSDVFMERRADKQTEALIDALF